MAKNRIGVFLGFAILAALLAAPVSAAGTLDFESYPQFFPADSIHVGALSFEGNNCWAVDNFLSQFFTLISAHTLGGCLVDTPLGMDFSTPTSSLTFNYAFGTPPGPGISLDVTGYLAGQQVFHQVFVPTSNNCAAFPTCEAEGTVSISTSVDRVVVVPSGEEDGPTFINAAIDDIQGIPTPDIPTLSPGFLAALCAGVALSGSVLLRR